MARFAADENITRQLVAGEVMPGVFAIMDTLLLGVVIDDLVLVAEWARTMTGRMASTTCP